MKKIILFATAFLFASCAYSSGESKNSKDNTRIEEVRNVKGFQSIALQGSSTIYYTQGETYSVKVVAPKRLMDKVKTELNGKTLVVYEKDDNAVNFFTSGKDSYINIYITSPDLVQVMLKGSGDFYSKGHLDTDNMNISLKGSGDIKFTDIICDNIQTELVGSGDIELDNVDAMTSKVSLTGSGNIDVKQKNVKQTGIMLKGSGDIDMMFSNCGAVKSELKGSGDVTLKGSIRSLDKDKLGSGDYNTGSLTIKP